MSARLTETKIRNSKIGGDSYRLADGGGLFMLITPAGNRLWRWKYRFHGAEKLMTFGAYPDVSLAEVRQKHAAARKLLASGSDPMAQRMASKLEQQEKKNTFESVAKKWHEHWKIGKSPRHADSVWRRLQSDVFPRLGQRPITEIEAIDVVKLVRAISDRGVTDLAKRALQVVHQIFRYAIPHKYATRNPAADFKPGDVLPSTETQNFARIDEKELPDLLKRIEVYQGTPSTRLAMKLMNLTFVRTSELIGARWDEFDFDARRWNIPKDRMKPHGTNGAKTPHIVPLSRQAIELLETLRLVSGESKQIFPGERKAPHMSNNTILSGLKRMGYKGQMTGHGFRGLASTILHEHGFAAEHIELQLAHQKRDKVAAAYNHAKYLPQRAEMMQWWADYLDSRRRGAKVIAMRQPSA